MRQGIRHFDCGQHASLGVLFKKGGALQKVPPHSVEAEEFVLGACLRRPAAWEHIVQIVRPEDFYDPRHTSIFRALCEVGRRSEPVDLVSVSAELERTGTLGAVGEASRLAALADAVAFPPKGRARREWYVRGRAVGR